MINSMTSFARLSTQGDWGTATWEIRSVNHRYFECVFKMPEVMRQLEMSLRQLVQQQLHRGKIECSLRFYPGEKSGIDFSLNTALVKKLTTAITEVRNFLDISKDIDPLKILSWPQVLQVSDEATQETFKIIVQLFEKAIAEVLEVRAREGDALKLIIEKKLEAILEIEKQVRERLPQIIANQRAKLISRLEEIKNQFDPLRLEQEMVLFAQRIDVAEELERLETHVKEVGRVLKMGGNVGKRLDFLMQELNREANTLGSKSVDVETTSRAVDLKVIIEEMREQVQNIV